MIRKIQESAKFVAAILTVLVTAGVGLIPAQYIDWVQFAVAILGAVAVYAVPNRPASELPKHIQDSFDSADEFVAGLDK